MRGERNGEREDDGSLAVSQSRYTIRTLRDAPGGKGPFCVPNVEPLGRARSYVGYEGLVEWRGGLCRLAVGMASVCTLLPGAARLHYCQMPCRSIVQDSYEIYTAVLSAPGFIAKSPVKITVLPVSNVTRTLCQTTFHLRSPNKVETHGIYLFIYLFLLLIVCFKTTLNFLIKYHAAIMLCIHFGLWKKGTYFFISLIFDSLIFL